MICHLKSDSRHLEVDPEFCTNVFCAETCVENVQYQEIKLKQERIEIHPQHVSLLLFGSNEKCHNFQIPQPASGSGELPTQD